ncbi:glycogen synthase GlgA [Thermovibrio sp.]
MRILFCSSEVYPFAKTGGLADVSYSLPKALSQLGVEVQEVMPLYKCVDRQKFKLKFTGKRIEVNLGGKVYEFRVWELKDSVHYYFLENDTFYNREYLYGTPEGDYPDNDLRFGGFCWAVARLIKEKFFKVDIVHTNDWQTSLIPVISKKKLSLNVKNLQTIHNLAYQGVFPKETIERLNLGWELFHMEALEFWGKVNFLKGGIVFSDAVNTVSPTYAKEIMTPEFGFGLDGVLRKYSYKLFGILNGIDYDVWNPEIDPFIYANYSDTNIERKEINKEKLLREVGLNVNKPLFIFIGRFAKQKGIDLIESAIEELKRMDANFLILGFGDERYNEFFRSINHKAKNIRAKVEFNEELSHKMYAAGDFLLMPSLFEPCGLNQMIAMRYGTLVVGRKTGGIADTVKDIKEEGGYGILFEEFSPSAFINGVKRALELYKHMGKFKNLQKKVMNIDFSWSRSATQYLRLYENLLEGAV